MKILHVIFSLHTGGAETMLVDIINEQSNTEIVELLIINDFMSDELISKIDKKVTIHYLRRKPSGRNPIPIIKFNYLIFKISPSVIHFHNHNAIKLLKYKTNALTCLTIHSVNVPIINLLKYKKVFSISNAVREDVLMRGGIKSILVYNGIKFNDVKIRCNFDKPSKFKIVQVSRLNHELKGQDILIKALDILVKEKKQVNLQIDFIGEGNSLTLLKNLVKELNIEKYVNFLGIRTRKFIYENLANYQLLVQPSIYEGFGLTVVEGIAAKIPVLVSDNEGPMEIIDYGKYGYYFKTGNAKNCCEVILEIITDFHTDKIGHKVNEAYNHSELNFNIRKTAKNYINNYKQ